MNAGGQKPGASLVASGSMLPAVISIPPKRVAQVDATRRGTGEPVQRPQLFQSTGAIQA